MLRTPGSRKAEDVAAKMAIAHLQVNPVEIYTKSDTGSYTTSILESRRLKPDNGLTVESGS